MLNYSLILWEMFHFQMKKKKNKSMKNKLEKHSKWRPSFKMWLETSSRLKKTLCPFFKVGQESMT